MGLNAAGGSELAPTVASGTLNSVAAGAQQMMQGLFNAILLATGFTGSIQLERSFDGGTTWNICSMDAAGTQAIYTGSASLTVNEPEPGVYYRWNMTARSGGSIAWRISGGARNT